MRAASIGHPPRRVRGQAIRVVIADRHPLFRDGVRALLADAGIEVVGDAGTLSLTVAAAAGAESPTLILDLELEGSTNVGLVTRARHHMPSAGIVVLSACDETATVIAALRSGASAYVLKAAPAEEIALGVRSAARGDSFVSSQLVPGLVDAVREADDTRARGVPETSGLSMEELAVLALLAQGCDNGEIASRLLLSPSTVKSRVSSILLKLGKKNRIQAAVHAAQRGLL